MPSRETGEYSRGMQIERMDMAVHNGALVEEHLDRYRFAATCVAGKEVLDVACGSGYGSAMLADGGAARVVGVDRCSDAIESATRNYPRANVTYRLGDAQDLAELPAESFDFCVSFETIEHLPDVPAYLRAVHRVLRPEGKFLVSTPNRRTGGLIEQITGKPLNVFHIHEFTESELRRVLSGLFAIDRLFGQNIVGRRWGTPLVQLPAKAVMKVLGMTEAKKRIYHRATGSTVREISSSNVYPRFIIALCTKLTDLRRPVVHRTVSGAD
jgi:SAM-dependent methyltransferase